MTSQEILKSDWLDFRVRTIHFEVRLPVSAIVVIETVIDQLELPVPLDKGSSQWKVTEYVARVLFLSLQHGFAQVVQGSQILQVRFRAVNSLEGFSNLANTLPVSENYHLLNLCRAY
jgi:hypothetical protein